MAKVNDLRFMTEQDTLVNQIQDMLWDSDVFRELAMNQVPMPEGDESTIAQMDEHINACSEIQAQMINSVLIKLLQRNNEYLS